MFFYDASMNLIEQLSRRRDTRGVEILLLFFYHFCEKKYKRNRCNKDRSRIRGKLSRNCSN